MISSEPKPNKMHEQDAERGLLASEGKRPPMEHAGFASVGHSEEPDLKKEAEGCMQKRESYISKNRTPKSALDGCKRIIERRKNVLDSDLYGSKPKQPANVVVGSIPPQQEDEQEKTQRKKRLSCRDIADLLLATDDWRKEDRLLLHYEKDKGFWRVLPKSNENFELRCCCDREYADEINKNSLSEVFEWLLTDAPDFPTASNAKSTKYINLKDVAIDWRDGCTTVHNRKNLYFRYYLNISSDDLENARNGSFEKFLKAVYPEDKQTEHEFKKFVGLALSGFRGEKTAAILHGPSNTGKSLVLNLLKKLMGKELTASVSFSQITEDFVITQLLGKSLSVSGEISGTNNKRLDVFKSITGRDTLTMSFKSKDHFQSCFYCMLVFASNVFPQIADVRELEIFLQRVQIFPFDNVVPRSEWIPNLEDVLYEDRGAILEFAMEGLRAWEADGRQFIESKAMLGKKKEFKRESNNFAIFLEEYACPNPMSRVTHREINKRYQEFCIQEGLVPLAGNVWPVILKETWPVKSVTIDGYDPSTNESSRNRGYQGIELRSTPYDSNVASQIFGPDKEIW